MAIGPNYITFTVQNGAAISATTEIRAWTNNTGGPVTLEGADYGQLTAITGHATNYYGVIVNKVTAAGVHTTAMAAYAFNTSAKNLTAYVAQPLTLVTTAGVAVLDDGEGVSVNLVKGGSASNLDASGGVDFRFSEGTGTTQ